jgi:hypothetical protein
VPSREMQLVWRPLWLWWHRMRQGLPVCILRHPLCRLCLRLPLNRAIKEQAELGFQVTVQGVYTNIVSAAALSFALTVISAPALWSPSWSLTINSVVVAFPFQGLWQLLWIPNHNLW